MADPILTPEQAQSLNQGGYLSDDLYSKMYPAPAVDDVPPPPAMGIADAGPTLPEPAPAGEPPLMPATLGGTSTLMDYTNAPAPNLSPAPPPAPMPPDAVGGNIQLASDIHGNPAPGGGAIGTSAADYLKAMQPDTSGLDMQENAAREAASVEGQKGKAVSDAQMAAVGENRDRIMKDDAKRVEGEKLVDDKYNDLQNAINDMSKNANIDQDRYWANKSDGQKAMMYLGLAFGAFDRKGNKAAEMLQNNINQDVKIQQANFDNKKAVAGAQETAYAHMMNKFHNRDLANTATTIALLNNSQLKVAAESEKFAAPEAKAKANMFIGQLEEKKKALEQQFKVQAMSLLPRLMDPDNPRYLPEADQGKYVPGFKGLTPSAKSGEDLRALNAETMSTKKAIDDLIALGKKPASSWNLDDKANAASLTATLQAKLGHTMFARFTQSELPFVKEMADNPTDIVGMGDYRIKKLERLKTSLDSNLASEAKAQGLTSNEDAIRKQIGFTQAKK